MPAHRRVTLDEPHVRGPAPRERQRALHAGRAATDHERVEAGPELRKPLRMPAAAVLLACGRVLGAADVAAAVGLGDAHVAADALADLVDASLVDLARQERVGDRGPGGADQIPHAAADDLGHQIGVGQPADAHDRLRGRLAHARGALELPALREEARGAGIERPLRDRADGDVPEIDEVVGQAHELEALLELHARARPCGRPRCGRRSRSRRRPPRARPRASRSRSARDWRASRRRRPCAGCRAATGTAPAGRCGRHRRRRCRSRRRASARPRVPSRPGTRRMSRCVIARGTRPVAKSLAIWEGAAAGSRDSLFSPCAPVCESSMPASAPCAVRLVAHRRSAGARRPRPTCAPRRTASRPTPR